MFRQRPHDPSIIIPTLTDGNGHNYSFEENPQHYISSLGATITGTLVVSGDGAVIFNDGQTQQKAYSNERHDLLESLNGKLSQITYDIENQITTIDGEIKIIQDEIIPMSKIKTLIPTIGTMQTDISTN